MFLCSNCRRLYDGVAVTVSVGPCEVCGVASPCGDFKRYTRKSDKELSQMIDRLEAALVTIRDTLPLANDEYAQLVFKTAANALEPEPQH